MPELSKRTYDLAERTRKFAINCRTLVKKEKNNSLLRNDVIQLIRSSGSVAANYLEADEALSKKDFVMRVKICRKEARESMLWLDLLLQDGGLNHKTVQELKDEAYQLVKIFNAIIGKSV